MKRTRIVVAFVLAALGITVFSGDASALTDGKWNATVSCGPFESPSRNLPAFSMRLPTLNVTNQQFTVNRTYKEPKNEFYTGSAVEEQWRGEVSSGVLLITAKSQRDNGASWSYQLKAPNSTDGVIPMQGVMLNAKGEQIRNCSLALTLVEAQPQQTQVPAQVNVTNTAVAPTKSEVAQAPAATKPNVAVPASPLANPSPAPAAQVAPKAPAVVANTTPANAAQASKAIPPAQSTQPAAGPVTTTPTVSPSFDCSKATLEHEKAICSSPKLAALDLAVSEQYKSAQSTATDAAKLKSDQVDWIKETRKCGGEVACLERAYTQRIAELTAKPTVAAVPQVTATSPTATNAIATTSGSESTAPPTITTQPNTPEQATPLFKETVDATITQPPANQQPLATLANQVKQLWANVWVRYGLFAVAIIAILAFLYWVLKKAIAATKRGAEIVADKSSELAKGLAERAVAAKTAAEVKAKAAIEHAKAQTDKLATDFNKEGGHKDAAKALMLKATEAATKVVENIQNNIPTTINLDDALNARIKQLSGIDPSPFRFLYASRDNFDGVSHLCIEASMRKGNILHTGIRTEIHKLFYSIADSSKKPKLFYEVTVDKQEDISDLKSLIILTDEGKCEYKVNVLSRNNFKIEFTAGVSNLEEQLYKMCKSSLFECRQVFLQGTDDYSEQQNQTLQTLIKKTYSDFYASEQFLVSISRILDSSTKLTFEQFKSANPKQKLALVLSHCIRLFKAHPKTVGSMPLILLAIIFSSLRNETSQETVQSVSRPLNDPNAVAEQIQIPGVSRCLAASAVMGGGLAREPSVKIDGPEIRNNNAMMGFFGSARTHLIVSMRNPAIESVIDKMVRQQGMYFENIIRTQGWDEFLPSYKQCANLMFK